jgi:hydroxymethylpyrimidine pyrophosphatase-like HAD family hydrolase
MVHPQHELNYDLTSQKLQEATKKIRLIISDYDGTLQDGKNPTFDESSVIALTSEVLKQQKYIAIITARGITGEKLLETQLLNYLEIQDWNAVAYLGLGNGVQLKKLTKNGVETVFSHQLTNEEMHSVLKAWIKVNKLFNLKINDLQPKGVETFLRLLNQDWSQFISQDIVNIAKPYNGQIFTEQVKVTAVLPKDESIHTNYVKTLEDEINSEFQKLGGNPIQVKRGDTTYVHITHAFNVDSKLFSLQAIVKDLELKPKEVAVFGDMPNDNDKGMLIDSRLPFTFTNTGSNQTPPYLLPDALVSPVGSVHTAIKNLIK